MRTIKKYTKKQGSKMQKDKLKIINKFQDDLAKCYYDTKYKNKDSN